MVKILPHIHNPLADEDIVKDTAVLTSKKKVMGSLRWNSLLNGISTIGALIGGPLFAAGIMGAANALFVEGAAVGTGFAAAIGGMPVVAMLGVGALFVGVAVASTYAASRIWQSKQFDNFEINAESTAHHLVKELKANDMCLTDEHATPARADGKTWQQTVIERRAAQQQQHI